MRKIELNLSNKKEVKERECVEGIPVKLFEHLNQIKMINTLYLDIDSYIDCKKEFIREIDKKIASYKAQDINRKKYKDDNINQIETIEKLVISKLKCYYCKCRMKIFYNKVREPTQWTLDRIDNRLPHQNDNVIICCLDCNLKRRTRDKDKFLFTKQLKIVKEL